ncbi:MAG: hypothetical protein M3Q58_00660 [Bacteroidota bacterium]|nr:hypothetical protein [Bacteroidota bacterium]
MKIILHLIVFILLVSCKKNPEACINVSEKEVEIGQTITFGDCSKNGFSREWFIQGNKYVEEIVTLKMDKPGNYTANLLVHSKNELVSDTATIEFSVVQPMGKITFWTKAPFYLPITVAVSGHGVQKIISSSEQEVNCDHQESANFFLPEGMHLYTAVPQSGATWVDSVNVLRNQCIRILLE